VLVLGPELSPKFGHGFLVVPLPPFGVTGIKIVCPRSELERRIDYDYAPDFILLIFFAPEADALAVCFGEAGTACDADEDARVSAFPTDGITGATETSTAIRTRPASSHCAAALSSNGRRRPSSTLPKTGEMKSFKAIHSFIVKTGEVSLSRSMVSETPRYRVRLP
jgi:hypothetical protein